MKLITELNEDVRYLTEEVDGKKEMFIEGIFLQGNIQNRNGRVYPMSVLDKSVQAYSEAYINKNRAMGELNHPQGPTINLDRVSHTIISLKKEGNNYVGKAKLLNTPMGNIAKNLIEGGTQLGVSSRGLGSLKENSTGIMEVQNDYFIATAADIVADPSAPDALINGIMENVEWIWEDGIFTKKILENVKEEIHKISKADLYEAKIKAFKKLIYTLGT